MHASKRPGKDRFRDKLGRVVMMFGLKTAPTTFQCIITEIFGEYIPGFLQVFLDDFAVYDGRAEHLRHLWLYLE